jgi:hypothetical protein
MKRRGLLPLSTFAALIFAYSAAFAQMAERAYRVGVLAPGGHARSRVSESACVSSAGSKEEISGSIIARRKATTTDSPRWRPSLLHFRSI